MNDTILPRISVIMATYNCEKTIRKSIDSVLSQTYKDFEFIICDDCSTDTTYDILKEYNRKYPDIFVILKNDKNSKLSFSLNRCLEVSRGEYIARMDGDDISLPERFEKQIKYLDAHPEMAVVGVEMLPFDENGTREPMLAKECPTPRDLIKGPCFFHATIMMRKTAYDAVGGYTVSKRTERAQDYDMWFRFFEKGLKGYNIQEGLYLVLEDRTAFKRRNFKSRCYEVQTRLIGYKKLHFPFYTYIYAFKPVLAALTPVSLMRLYHEAVRKKRRLKRNGDQIYGSLPKHY